MFDPKIQPGDLLTNQEISKLFISNPQRGMKKSNTTNTLVLMLNHTKSLYYDRWVNGVLHYTGMGKSDDQPLNRENKTLAESKTNGITVHLFEAFEPKYYTYIGIVELAGEPYKEKQLGDDGKHRKVWVFPLQLVGDTQILIEKEAIDSINKLKAKKAQKLTLKQVIEKVEASHKISGSRTVTTTITERNQYVSQYCKIRANGTCQLCGTEAPFNNSNGEPYLECHHIIWLSKGGEDTIYNTVALCPNCHRKMHIINDSKDIELLVRAAQQLIK